jgi:hypothetical protein
MKKFIGTFFAFAIVFGLAGCDKQETKSVEPTKQEKDFMQPETIDLKGKPLALPGQEKKNNENK